MRLIMAPLPKHSFDYINSLIQRTDEPLRKLHHWRPFRIDALGLVTLLGAEEVDLGIGTLQKRRFTEWVRQPRYKPYLRLMISISET